MATKEQVENNLPAAPSNALVDFMDRVKDLDPEKLSRALDVFERWQKNAAEQEYNEAMARARRKFLPVKKDSTNPLFHSKFSSLAANIEACEQALDEEGIVVSFVCRPSEDQGHDKLRVRLTLSRGMHSVSSEHDWPVSIEGPRGGRPAMTPVQSVGSAMTYARRYMLAAALNLKGDKGSDDDGNSAGGRIMLPPDKITPDAAFAPFGVSPEQIANSGYSHEQLATAYREIKRDGVSAITKWFPPPRKGNAGLKDRLSEKLNTGSIPPVPGQEEADERGPVQSGVVVDSGGGASPVGAVPDDPPVDAASDPFGLDLDLPDPDKPRLSEIKLKKLRRGGGFDWEEYADRLITAIAECDDVSQIYEIRTTDNLTFGMKNNAPLRLSDVMGALTGREDFLRRNSTG